MLRSPPQLNNYKHKKLGKINMEIGGTKGLSQIVAHLEIDGSLKIQF
jgi:hypothetical protein